MRILVVTPTFLPTVGGAEVLVYEVYTRLASSHEVCVLTPAVASGHRVESATIDYQREVYFGVREFKNRFDLLKLRGHRMLHGLIPPFSLSAVAAVASAVQELKPDVINAHYAVPTGLAAVVVGRVRHIPVVLTFSGRDVPGPTTPPLWRFYDRFIANLATDVTYISNYCRTAVNGAPGKGKGQTIYGGVDVNRFHPQVDGQSLRRELGMADSALVLFALQRLSPEKRTDIVLASMRHVLRVRDDVILVVGGKGREEPHLRKLIASLGIEHRVVLTGYIPDDKLPQFFALADIFVFHSTYETFGLVLAQAMAAGKPIVSVKSTAIPEVVEEGSSGILVEPLDAKALAWAILTLAGDPELRRKMGQSGRERAIGEFAWGHIASQYEAVMMDNARL